mmetsp:Transcript_43676/g.103086  ORF Transcript_43676/g.103086 Transcript_43676/m.103086 type:complete len:595 (-) Transcript_43676:71-1855(-)
MEESHSDDDERHQIHKENSEAPSRKVKGKARLQPASGSARVVYAGLQDEDPSAKEETEAAAPCGGMCRCCVTLLDDRTDTHRYVIHFLLCCFLPGPYFMDAQFGAYEQPVCYDVLNIGSEDFEWFFALPALTGALCGPLGSIIARLGDTLSSLCAGTVVMSSTLFVLLGLQVRDFYMVLIGRITFWLGIYMLYAVQTIVVYQLFQGQALTIAYGVVISLMRAGCVMGYFLSGVIYQWMNNNAVDALKLSIGLVAGAFLATAAFAWLRSDRVKAYWAPVLRGNGPRLAQGHNRIPSLGQLRSFRTKTWVLMAQIGILYGITFPFETIAAEFFEIEWDLPPQAAGQVTSLAATFGIFAWVIGFLIGGLPAMLRMNVVAWWAYIVAFLMLFFKRPLNPVVPMSVFGLGYAYMATISWVILPLTLGTDRGNRTVAVSVAYTSLAISMFWSNLAVGLVQDHFGFHGVLSWFIFLACCGLCCGIFLWRLGAAENYMWCTVDPTEQGTGEEMEGIEDQEDALDTDDLEVINSANFVGDGDVQVVASDRANPEDLHHRLDESKRGTQGSSSSASEGGHPTSPHLHQVHPGSPSPLDRKARVE